MHEDISVCSQTCSSSSLRDAEWRQLCRHSELRHSSLLPQSLCGRRVAAVQARSVVQLLHLSECEICDMVLMLSTSAPRCCCLLHSCMGAWEDVLMRRCSPPLSLEASCACRGMCVTLTIPPSSSSQELLSYAAWFLSVPCRSHISAENRGKVDSVCWWHLLFICLGFLWGSRLPPADCSQLQRSDRLKRFYL